MSQRFCDHLTGGQLCHTIMHSSVRVGLPGQPAVWIRLCHHHRNTDDNELILLAKAKASRRKVAGEIETSDIASGLLVARKSDGGLARVTAVTPTGVSLRQTGGQFNGCSHDYLKKHYRLPAMRAAHEETTTP